MTVGLGRDDEGLDDDAHDECDNDDNDDGSSILGGGLQSSG